MIIDICITNGMSRKCFIFYRNVKDGDLKKQMNANVTLKIKKRHPKIIYLNFDLWLVYISLLFKIISLKNLWIISSIIFWNKKINKWVFSNFVPFYFLTWTNTWTVPIFGIALFRGPGVNDLGKVKLTSGRAMARAVFTQENPTLVVTWTSEK